MSVNAFLKLDGVPGESQDDKHKGEIDLISFSWGASDPTVIGSGTEGAGSGKATFKEFSITKLTDQASPAFFQGCAAGAHYKNVVITVRKAGKDYLKYTLSNVLVSSYQIGSNLTDEGYSPIPPRGDDGPIEQVTFNFTKFEIDYTEEQGPTHGTVVTAVWDTSPNTAGVPTS